MSTTARAARPARRFRLASPVTVGVLAIVVLALLAAGWPLARLAHLSVNDSSGVVPWWLFTPFGVVGLVVAWRKPRNALGWCLVGLVVAGALSEDGSFYAVADYRLRHGTLPLGWVAMIAQPGWAIAIALIGLALLLFPDGKLAFARLRWALWLSSSSARCGWAAPTASPWTSSCATTSAWIPAVT